MEQHKKIAYKILQSMGAQPHKVALGESLEGMFGDNSAADYQSGLDWLIIEKKWLEQLQGAPLVFKLTQAGRRESGKYKCSAR